MLFNSLRQATDHSSAANTTAEDRHSRSRSRSHDRGGDRDKERDRSRSRSRHDTKHRSKRSRSRSYSSSRSRSPKRRDHRDRGGDRYRRRSRSDSRSHSPRRDRGRKYSRDADEKKLLGDDDVTDEFVRVVAVEVKSRGEEYEAALKEREKGNSKFSFLADHRVFPIRFQWSKAKQPTSTANTDTTARSCEAARRWNPSSMTKGTIPFIPPIPRRSRNGNARGSTIWVSLPGKGLKPCSERFLEGEVRWGSVWRSAWNTPRPRQR